MSTYIEPVDGQPRCNWCGGAAEFLPYHDNEWGFPVKDDIRLFEKLCLESFQSGLSWRTILNKRENFRVAFKGFDFHQVARFEEQDIQRLLQDAGIVRHRGKIEAVINNAQRAIELIDREGSLAGYFWRFEEAEPDTEQLQMRATSSQSEALSKALKKQGWKFVGPTTVYAFMQAMGLVNDHAADCITRQKVTQARKTFNKP